VGDDFDTFLPVQTEARMKMRLARYRMMSLLAPLVLVFLFGGQAFACLSPSLMDMREGRSMSCCEQHCRVETTPQAAQQACAQSHAAISHHQAIAGPSIVFMTLKDIPNVGMYSIHDPPAHPVILSLSLITADALAPPGRAVDLYLVTHSLLI
jgi:hypothetical protein